MAAMPDAIAAIKNDIVTAGPAKLCATSPANTYTPNPNVDPTPSAVKSNKFSTRAKFVSLPSLFSCLRRFNARQYPAIIFNWFRFCCQWFLFWETKTLSPLRPIRCDTSFKCNWFSNFAFTWCSRIQQFVSGTRSVQKINKIICSNGII